MKNNKKGFTIVELVIVIAVIAILAAVLIPTFSSVINKANQSSAMQEARTAYLNYLADHDELITGNNAHMFIKLTKGETTYIFEADNGKFEPVEAAGTPVLWVNGETLSETAPTTPSSSTGD